MWYQHLCTSRVHWASDDAEGLHPEESKIEAIFNAAEAAQDCFPVTQLSWIDGVLQPLYHFISGVTGGEGGKSPPKNFLSTRKFVATNREKWGKEKCWGKKKDEN